MMNESELVQLLQSYGLTAEASDEQISTFLVSQQLSAEERNHVQQLVQKLRSETKQAQNSGANKLFRTGERLKPSEISHLLGVSVTVSENIVADRQKPSTSFLHMMLWSITSIALAGSALFAYMYTMKIGVFHPAMQEVAEQR